MKNCKNTSCEFNICCTVSIKELCPYSTFQPEFTFYQLEGQRFLRERWEEKAGKVKHTSTQRLPGPDELRKSEKSKLFEELLKQPRYQFYSSSVRAGKNFIRSMLNMDKSMEQAYQIMGIDWDGGSETIRVRPFEDAKAEEARHRSHTADAERYACEHWNFSADNPNVEQQSDISIFNPCPFGYRYGWDWNFRARCKVCLFITNHACRQFHTRLSNRNWIEGKDREDQKDFSALRANRKVMGAFRYGLFGDVENKPQWDRLLAIEKKIKEYRETGNDELLVDIANLCELEFVEGIHPNKHFSAADDKGHVEGK